MANRLREVTNPRIYKRLMRRKKLVCDYCPPNRSENAKSYFYKRKKKEFQLTPSQMNWNSLNNRR